MRGTCEDGHEGNKAPELKLTADNEIDRMMIGHLMSILTVGGRVDIMIERSGCIERYDFSYPLEQLLFSSGTRL